MILSLKTKLYILENELGGRFMALDLTEYDDDVKIIRTFPPGTELTFSHQFSVSDSYIFTINLFGTPLEFDRDELPMFFNEKDVMVFLMMAG